MLLKLFTNCPNNHPSFRVTEVSSCNHAAHNDNLILAFCLSMVVGLLIGSLVWVLLTWMSRRRASASISTRNPRQSRAPSHSRSGFYRNSSYDRRSNNSLASAAFTFHRQASLEQPDPLGRKPSFRASTFHPLLQCSQIAREAEEGSQTTLPRSTAGSGSGSNVATPARPDSFWCSSSLRGFHATQTPPPAYESVIRAFQETCT
ncbi:myc target protein 1 homolog isoform X1 [Lepisosteus oculatus]|uniref:myc target protein 1 homolog isoform X1 n=1 Tax=Lepisosteus oculatus TaxID=7918 RepID=UPI0007403286|nr:PREDICTED: myc target protein 1 isoform X2 [Lepisosteus oculatus]